MFNVSPLFFEREKEEGREEGRDRNIHVREKRRVVALTGDYTHLTRDCTQSLGMCPDQESNSQSFG